MKKVMWLGLSIEITVLIIMLLFVVFKKPIPGVLVGIFVAGMLTSIISSFFVQREKVKEN
jgi:MFS superfamily sulfate permease-like transporter